MRPPTDSTGPPIARRRRWWAAAIAVAALGVAAGCGGRGDGTGPGTAAIADASATTTTTAPTSTSTATTAPTSTSTTAPSSPIGDAATDGAAVPDVLAGLADGSGSDRPVVRLAVEIVETHPHDPTAYTQGLEMVDGMLLESTGLRGESTLRLVSPRTGEIVRSVPLDDDLFGEGATVVDDQVWQLTWTSETALLRGLDDLGERRRVPYQGEGWGLCAQADQLVMSNGSSRLSFRDPSTFAERGSVDVTADGEPVPKLNELECVGGLVLANVYQTTRLVVIDPADGRVVAEADLSALVPPGFEGDDSDVANGVANDPETGRLWLTGKRWPVIYEVELVPSP